MSNERIVMDYAEYLNDSNELAQIRDYYCQQSAILKEDIFNHIVILLTMCVNRELQLLLEADDDISVEKYPERVMEIYKEISEVYTDKNKVVAYGENILNSDQDAFEDYLNHMVKCLLSGIKYIEKKDEKWSLCDAQNEWNTRYRREERIRDNMKCMISTDKTCAKFTIAHHIEIPYMYVLAWDLPNLFEYFERDKPKNSDDKSENSDEDSEEDSENSNDDSYFGNLRENTRIELGLISENLLEILLHGKQSDQDKYEDIGNTKGLIMIAKMVDYTNLLPSISIVDHVEYFNELSDPRADLMAMKKHIVPYMKKEVLKRRPLLPMETNKRIFMTTRSLEMMVNLLIEEKAERGDIYEFRDDVMKMCNKLLKWIFKGNKNILANGKDKNEAVTYLKNIIERINQAPKNRDGYIKNIVDAIAKEWDTASLRCERTIDKNSDSYIRYSYFSVLKLARNWNEHKLLKNISIHFCVFLYLISMRYMVDLNKLDIEAFTDYLHLEAKLFKLLGENKQVYDQIEASELEKEYLLLYKNVCNTAFDKKLDYEELPNWVRDFPRDAERKPHQVLNTAGYSKSNIKNTMSEYEIFLTFWLTIHMGENNTLKKIENSRDIDLLEILERTYEYQKKSSLLRVVEQS